MRRVPRGRGGGAGGAVGGGLRTDSLEALLAGGESGEPAVVPGDVHAGTPLDAVTWAS